MVNSPRLMISHRLNATNILLIANLIGHVQILNRCRLLSSAGLRM